MSDLVINPEDEAHIHSDSSTTVETETFNLEACY